MAIARWIGGFGTNNQGSSNTTADAATNGSKEVEVSKAEHKQFGYENFGNTCYVNSVLQALYFCHPFRELVAQFPDKSNPATDFVQPPPPAPSQATIKAKNTKTTTTEKGKSSDANVNGNTEASGPPIPATPPTIFSALRALFVHISRNSLDRGTVSPKAFMEKLRMENELFRSTMHQDAHEFLNYLLNRVAEDLEEEDRARSRGSSGEDLSESMTSSRGTVTTHTSSANSSSVRHATLVHSLFEGTLTSETRCLTCETVSSRDEAFLDLSIDIEQNSSVTACLRQFSASEMLCQKNKFFCDSCCGLQEAEKRMKIKKLPNVLALHLKRFKYQEDVQKYIKLTYRVAFPFELRLFNTVDDAQDPDRLYQLFAIVVHIGSGPNHGHYVAIVKSRGSWVIFDDDCVDTIKESEIPRYFGDSNCGSAYVLYYQAVDLDLGALGLRTAAQAAESTESAEVSPNLSSRLLPPGLSVNSEATSSDPGLATSSSSSSKRNPPSPLTVTIPPPDSLPVPAATSPLPTMTTPSIKTGGFSILRHTASLRGLAPSVNKASSSQAAPPLPSISSSPPPTEPTDTSIGNEPLSPIPVAAPAPSPAIVVNGKSKSGKDWSGGWFSKRRSVKADKSPEVLPTYPRQPSVAESNKTLQPSIINSAEPRASGSTGDVSLHPPAAESTRDSSPAASLLSTPAQLPSIPSTSSTSSYGKPVTSHAHHPPDHKKSQPILKTTPAPGLLLQRSATAGALPTLLNGRTADIPPPPVPSLPPDIPTVAFNDNSNISEAGATTQVTAPSLTQAQQSQSPPSSSINRRTSRKYSFTGSGLFGRKDKHKDNKDKDTYISANHTSIVPGMSIVGRM